MYLSATNISWNDKSYTFTFPPMAFQSNSYEIRFSSPLITNYPSLEQSTQTIFGKLIFMYTHLRTTLILKTFWRRATKH